MRGGICRATYDAEIRVGTKVDTSQMQRLQLQIDKAAKKAEELQREYDELSEKQIPTDAYKKREDSLNKTKIKLDELIAEEEKMASDGLAIGAPWDNVLQKEADAQLKIEAIQAEMQELVDTGKAFTVGENSEELNKTANDLAKAKAELRMLVTKQNELNGSTGKLSDRLRKIGAAAGKAFTALDKGVTKVFTAIKDRAKSAFSTVRKETGKTNGLLAAMKSRLQGIALSLLVFNWISKGFNAMVTGMKDGFKNLVKYSDEYNASMSKLISANAQLKNSLAAAFAPLVSVVIPYLVSFINMLSAAATKVAEFIAALTGKSVFLRATKQLKDYRKELGGTAAAAKKAAGQLAAFDKLNVVRQDKDDSSGSGGDDGGSGAGFEEVPVSDEMRKLAEKLKDILKKIFDPLKKAWEKNGKYVMDSWKYALDEIWKLIKSIGKDFLDVWNQDKTVKIFEDLLHIIGDIGVIVGNLARNFRYAWEQCGTGKKILENLRDIVGVIVRNIHKAAETTVAWSSELDFSPLLTQIEKWTGSLVHVFDNLSGIVRDFYEHVLLPLAKWSIERGLPDLLQVFIDFNNKVNWVKLRKEFEELWKKLEPFAERVGEGLILFLRDISDALAGFVNGDKFRDILTFIGDWMESVDAQAVCDTLHKVAKTLIIIKAGIIGLKAIKKVIPALKTARDIFKASHLIAIKFKTKLSDIAAVLGKLMSAIKLNGLGATLKGGITKLLSSLTKLQKGMIGVTAIVAEFFVIKDAFYGIAKGCDNVAVSIGKIVVAAGVAAGALYVAFGPAGIAVAAITGIIAAIIGIGEAMKEIQAEEVGNVIKNAMTKPGGVALSELVGNMRDSFTEAAKGFDTIADKSSEMESVQGRIKDTWLEIDKIQEAMENGVISVEEGKAQLESLFTQLAELTEQKFSAMNTVIMSAYGENGSLTTALNNMGADTETAIDTMIEYGYQNSEKAKEIAEQLAGTEVGTEEYKELTKELMSLSGEMDSFTVATGDYAREMTALQKEIDYSEIFLDDGSVDTEALQRYLDDAASALNEYETALDDAGKEISREWQEICDSPFATAEQKEVAQEQLKYIPDAIASMKADAELEVVGFTDMMQTDFIQRTSDIITDAQEEWDSKSDWDKFWSNVFGGGEGNYIADAIQKQEENTKQLSDAIEGSFGDLKINGVAWAGEASAEMYDALFTSYTVGTGVKQKVTTINDQYRELIDDVAQQSSKYASERGKDVTEGFNNGIDDNSASSEETAQSWMERLKNAIHDSAMRFGSPSKTAQDFGKDTVTGYNQGVTNSIQRSVSAIKNWMKAIESTFKGIVQVMANIGKDSMSALIDGLTSRQEELQKKVEELAEKSKSVGTSAGSGGSKGGGRSTTKSMSTTGLPRLTTESIVRGGNPYIIMAQAKGQSVTGLSASAIKQAVSDAIRDNAKAFGGDMTVTVPLDGREIYRNTVRRDQIFRKSTGHSAFEGV